MSWLLATIVPASIVNGNAINVRVLVSLWVESRYIPVVPENRSSRRPPPAQLDVNVLLVHIIQVSENDVALGLVKSHNSVCHGTVDPKGLPTGCRMNSNQRVNPLDVLGTSLRIISVQIGVCGPIHSGPSINDLAEFW